MNVLALPKLIKLVFFLTANLSINNISKKSIRIFTFIIFNERNIYVKESYLR